MSVQIRKLEDRLGQPVFERRNRQLHLTEAGRITLDYAETIFGAGQELIATLQRTGSPRQVLRVGAQATLSRNFQIEFLRPLLGKPDVELVLRSGSSLDLMEALETLGVDVVLTNRAPAPDALTSYIVHPVSQQPVSVIGTPARIDTIGTLADIGLAVMPPIVVKNELATVMLKEAEQGLGLSESFYAVTAKRKFPNPLLEVLLGKGIATQ